ncbi:GntR family transcriptional regulator [Nocardioides alkalitolerans]|uniref:GntR family transcriptional regulator n=1 Tax=Nocardioides alkalitolerans TaxID=281714 RepID=UPI001B7FD3ED|nr:GntR family transcriptional regulator [Nocardioides alkalitolerans]
MTTHTFTSKGDVAYAELRAQILSGALPAGSRLSQYELAAALGISITPLREAVRRLSGEGLIVLDTHRDARVAQMDMTEARELFETRRALDPAAIALAAVHRTPADIERMRAAVARLLPVTRQWGEPALLAHREVHQAIYCASHNTVMIRLLDDLWDKSDRYRRLGLELQPGAGPRTRDFEEHGEMVELVVAGDADAAAALMRRHIDMSLTAAALAAHEADVPTGTDTAGSSTAGSSTAGSSTAGSSTAGSAPADPA